MMGHRIAMRRLARIRHALGCVAEALGASLLTELCEDLELAIEELNELAYRAATTRRSP